MVSTLCLVPHKDLATKIRQSALWTGSDLQPFSINELGSHLLKERGYPYRDSKILEQIVLWEVVWELDDKLEHYLPLVNFPGFIQDLYSFFQRWSCNAVSLADLSNQEQFELDVLYRHHQSKLASLRILDYPAKIRQAIRYWPQSDLCSKVDKIEKYYLGELTPLEQDFISVIEKDKKVVNKQFSRDEDDTEAKISAKIAPRPADELEYIAADIVDLLNDGIDPERIAIVSANLREYLPVITTALEKYRIPWNKPDKVLLDTVLGKAITVLLQSLLGDLSKSDLEQLVMVGWGLPFTLSHNERRALKLAPSTLRGIDKWKVQLGNSRWQDVFRFLQSFTINKGKHPVGKYVTEIQSVFTRFPLSLWPARNLYGWAQLLKSYERIDYIFGNLLECRQQLSLRQFFHLWQSTTDNCHIANPIEFDQKVAVTSPDQIIGMDYHTVFFVGMDEASFPKRRRRDWLSRQHLPDNSLQIYNHIKKSTKNLNLSFAEANKDNKINIASSLYPKNPVILAPVAGLQPTKPLIRFGQGLLTDSSIIEDIITKYRTKQLSVSKLNIYVSCPFRFLCSELFELEEEEADSEEITAREEGDIIHKVLHRFWQEKGKIDIIDILDKYMQKAGKQLTKRITTMVREFNTKDIQLVDDSQYQPYYLEKRFSGLEIKLPTTTIRLRGIVDRIDVHPSGNCVIYDYKTGAKPSVRDIVEHKDLQLQVYLLAVKELIEPKLNGKIHGIAYYSIKEGTRTGLWSESEYRQLQMRRNSGVLATDDWQQIASQFYHNLQQCLSNIINGAFPIKPIDNRICNYCAYQGICRREN